MTARPLREWWRELDEITDLGPIVRRYFVIAVSVSASIALAISSMVGAYEAERVEKKLQRHSIERAMLVGISEEHRSAFRTAALVSAAVHGVAPVIAALIPVVPFFFVEFQTATIVATLLTLAFLFTLGAYLGSLVRERIVFTGLRFIATGLGTAAILWVFGTFGVHVVP